MPIPITLAELLRSPEPPVLIDVRRSAARIASGLAIPNSLRGDPGLAAEWGTAHAGDKVVVFCVHGHEVSQGVADGLAARGVDAAYLVGGFVAWKDGGHPVVAVGAES